MLPDIQIKQEPKALFPNQFGYVFVLVLGILLVFTSFLFGVVSTDLECTRAPSREIQSLKGGFPAPWGVCRNAKVAVSYPVRLRRGC
jgi:hypothetical protein